MSQIKQEDYPPGTIVFAKLKGYPWWPARVEDDKSIPPKVLKQRTSKAKGPLWTVFFFGSRDYGFFGPESIRPFNKENVEHDLKTKKFKTKDLENAVRQALDPSLLEKLEQEEEEEEEESEEEQQPAKKTKKTRVSRKNASEPTATNKKKAAGNIGRRGKKAATKETSSTSSSSTSSKEATATATEEEEEDESESPTKIKRRSRKLDDTDKEVNNEIDRKKRRKSVSTEKEEQRASPVVNRDNTNNASSDDKTVTPEEQAYQQEKDRMYMMRHRLQKLVYQKKPGEIPRDNYPTISRFLKQVEESHMTHRLFKDTKIGQVIKAAASYTYEEEAEYNIPKRCKQLMTNWKEKFRMEYENGKVEKPKSVNHEGTPSVSPKHEPKDTNESGSSQTVQPSVPVAAAEGNNSNNNNNGNNSTSVKKEPMEVDEPSRTKMTTAPTTKTVTNDTTTSSNNNDNNNNTTASATTTQVDTVMQEAS
ncbi:hypothetical protein INT45_002729 [Circinella minor]|uniref:PWWP domain-containing protein n=1 Tax=Circinella minor TaxID=1195481 RepID=A0A8H7VG33_9FUNG|nr:hypothetical protein INT45_002729 [Circinella minor]